MGHLKEHSFTGNTDHNFNGLSNNYLFKLNSSGTGITDSQIYDNGTNIAIGHSSPTAKIHIESDRSDSGSYSFKIKNSGGTEMTSFRDDGYTEFTKTGGQTIFGDQSSNYLTHIQNRLEQFSNASTYTGFHANRNGSGISLRATSANDISLIESTGTMTFSTNWDNNFNGLGTLAMLIDGDNQYVGIGMPTNLTIPGAKLNVRGSGNTGDGRAFLVQNSDGTNMMTINNAGLSMFGTTSTASTFGSVVGAVHAESTVTSNSTYNSTAVFTMTFNPSSNGVTYNRALNSAIIKYGAGNTNDVVATTSIARNDGSGTISNLMAIDAQTTLNSNSSVTNLYGIQAQTTLQASGTVTNNAAIRAVSSANQPGTTITNMFGLLVSSPVNTGGDVTNTYGIRIEGNTLGSTANWGLYQNGISNNNYFAGKIGIGTTGPTDMVHINGSTGSTQFRLEQSHTPTSSGSTSGNIGSVAWDDNYFYMKTNAGWGRIAWDYNF